MRGKYPGSHSGRASIGVPLSSRRNTANLNAVSRNFCLASNTFNVRSEIVWALIESSWRVESPRSSSLLSPSFRLIANSSNCS